MSRKLVRACLMVAAVAVLMSLTPGPSAAGSNLGQLCLNLGGTDTILMNLTLTDGPAFVIDVAFRWRSQDKFEMLGNGVITELYPLGDQPPGTLALGLNANNNTIWYLGNRTCSIGATLVPPSFGGPYRITCIGGTQGNSVVTGTLVVTSCATEPH